MEIDVTIERIDNGWIISGKGVTSGKHYYDSLEKFAALQILENLREIDKQIRHMRPPEKPFVFRLTTDLKMPHEHLND